MIKFFRRFRQQLLTENKFSKYLLYAFGEIVLVVIGILIALSINNWNEARKEKAIELDYLLGIKKDLETDIASSESRARAILKKLSDFHTLDSTFTRSRNDIPIEFQKRPLDSITIKTMFNRGPVNRITLGKFQSLTSNSSVSIIKNDELLQLIQEFYGTRYPAIQSVYEDIKRREEYVGWKYSDELRTLDIQAFFIDNPNRNEVLADFSFYYNAQGMMYNQLLNHRDYMAEIIKNINTELVQRFKTY